MKYINKKISDLLNNNLTLLSYELDNLESISLQLINNDMRLCLRINTLEQTANIVFMSGEELDNEEFVMLNKDINY